MKKILLALAFVLASASVNAQTTASQASAALDAKKATVERKLEAKQDETLAKIDAKIAKAKEAGKSTEKLEQKRREVVKRVSAKEKQLDKRIQTQKAKIAQ